MSRVDRLVSSSALFGASHEEAKGYTQRRAAKVRRLAAGIGEVQEVIDPRQSRGLDFMNRSKR